MQNKKAADLLELSEKHIKKISSSEDIFVEDSVDRILAKNIIPAVDVPSFVRSAVDGFAVISSDFSENNDVKLKVTQRITAGYSKELTPLNSKEAAFVTTGSPAPPEADAVILIEDVKEYSGGYILYDKTVEPGSYISPVGDDIKSGVLLYEKGHKVRLCDIAALSGIGLKNVSVYKKPLVGILSGGNELVSPGEKLNGNKIYDVNTTVLKSLIKDSGGIPEVIGMVEDNIDRLVETLKIADESKKYDLIISTGGTGASFLVLENKEITNFYDLIPGAIEKTGKLLFHGVNLVPGKPTSFGILKENTPIFALAGWPYSVIITFDLFIRTFIQKMMNINFTYKKYPKIYARLEEDVYSEKGVRKYFQVKLKSDGNSLIAKVLPAPKPPSAARSISPMINANGSFVMDEDATLIAKGESIEVTLNDYNIF